MEITANLTGSLKPGYVTVSSDALNYAAIKTQDPRSKKDTGACRQTYLSFPATRSILWDRRPLDSPIFLHMNQYRNPALIIEEKTLRLAHRFAQDSETDTYTCYLLASLTVNSDGEGICVNVDRFEAGKSVSNLNSCHSAHNIIIPCFVKKNSAKPKTSSDDFGTSIKAICQRCRSKSKINLGDFASMYAYCSYHDNQQNFIFHVDFTMVTSGIKLKLTPVNSVPIVPTALSKNLAGPLSMSGVQGEPKTGYLTMDQTRKLLLVLESDPKVPSLPLVGVWISGISNAHDPFVWASCLRYLFNPALEERVVVPPEAFLIVLYTPIHSKPEFYECVTVNGSLAMKLELMNGHEVIQLPKDSLGRAQSPLEIELLHVEGGEKKELFEAALENNHCIIEEEQDKGMKNNVGGVPDDITPRSIPAPHFTRAPVVQPSVPEVSLLLDENEGNFAPRPAPRPLRMSHTPIYPHPAQNINANKSKSKKKSKKSDSGRFYMNGQSSSQPTSPAVNGWNPTVNGSSLPNSPNGQIRAVYGPGGPSYPQHPQGSPQMMLQQYANQGQYSAGAMGQNTYPAGVNPISAAPTQQMYNHQMPSPNLQLSYNGNVTHFQQQQQYAGAQNPIVQSQPGQMFSPHISPNINAGNNQNMPQPQSLPWNVNGYSQTMVNNGPGYVANLPQVPPNTAQLMSHMLGCNPNIANFAIQQKNFQQLVNANSNFQEQQVNANSNPYSREQTQGMMHPNPVVNGHPQVGSNTHNTLLSKQTNSTNNIDFNVQQQHKSPRKQKQNSFDCEETLVKQISLSPINQSRQSNPVSADSSPNHESSSTDSGLHVSDTPDPDGLINSTIDSFKTSASAVVTSQPVAPDVYELLKMQDMQLKMLREQLSQLLAKQGSEKVVSGNDGANSSFKGSETAPPPSLQSRHSRDIATQSSNQATPQKVKILQKSNDNNEADSRCSVAINTSMMYPEPERIRHEAVSNNNSFNLTAQEISIHASSFEHMKTSNGSPVRIKSRILGPEHDGNNISTDTISFGELHLTGIQDRTEESMMSEMMVDMPAYGSLSPEKRSSSACTEDSNRSPLLGESVSMYERQNFADTEDNTAETGMGDSHPQVSLLYKNHKQFYQNLMGNVQKFLAKSSDSTTLTDFQNESRLTENSYRHSLDPPTGEQPISTGLKRSHSVPECMKQNEEVDNERATEPQEEDVALRTLKQLQTMGIEFDKLSSEEKSRIDQTLCLLDPIMLPKISYVSMMLDGDSDISAEADALAMKYLSDEQLTELSKLRLQSPSKSKASSGGLDSLLSSNTPKGKSNMTLYGSPNHMSFASKKYLERYGLLDSTSVDSDRSKENYVGSEDDTLVKTPTPKGDLMNVKEFLQKLSEKSFMEDVSIPKIEISASASKNQSVLEKSGQNSFHSCPSNCEDNSTVQHMISQKGHKYFSDPESFQGKTSSTPADQHHLQRKDMHPFDLTPNYTPIMKKPEYVNLKYSNNYTPRNQFNQTANSIPPSETNVHRHDIEQKLNKLPQIFEKTPQRNPQPRAPAYTDEGARGFTRRITKQTGPQSLDNVLDIERLRELPKLL